MENQDDLEALARRYIDFCQDQVTAFATDPDLAKAIQGFLSGPFAAGSPAGFAAFKAWGDAMGPVVAATALAAMNGASAAMQDGAAGHGKSHQGKDETGAEGRPSGGTGSSRAATSGTDISGADGPAPRGTAPADSALDLDGLEGRLAALEARITALETGSKAKRKSPGGRARSGKSRGT